MGEVLLLVLVALVVLGVPLAGAYWAMRLFDNLGPRPRTVSWIVRMALLFVLLFVCILWTLSFLSRMLFGSIFLSGPL